MSKEITLKKINKTLSDSSIVELIEKTTVQTTIETVSKVELELCKIEIQKAINANQKTIDMLNLQILEVNNSISEFNNFNLKD